jgi:hypothetical protein
MRATTVKVDGELLKELERTKPPGTTLTGWVRDILQREMQRLRLEAAAARYTEFLRDAPDERDWLAEWTDADLSRPPARRRR